MSGIYKKGQGYWTRTMSAIGFGLILLMGAQWLWDVLQAARVGDLQPTYVSSAGSVLFLATGGGIIYWLLYRHRRVVDFMVATESEMKKVNWSSRREILGSTWVVIGLTMFIAVIIAVLDVLFTLLFQAINVLEKSS